MGLMDSLFGSESDIDKIEQWSPEQWELFRKFLMPSLKGDYLTSGPTMSGMFGMDAWQEMLGRSEKYGEAAGGGFMDILNRSPEDINAYFQSSVYNPLMEQFTEETIPGISRKYAPSGFYSSQRVQGEQKATEDLADTLANARSNMAYEALQAQLNRKLQAATGLGSLGESTVNQMLGLGQFSAGLAGEEQRRKESRMQMMLSAMGLQPYGYAVTPGTAGIIPSLIGAAGQGAGYGLASKYFKG